MGPSTDGGDVYIIGGARATPGAVMLAGLAALRVGAGRLSLATAQSVAVAVAVALPEGSVTGLVETPTGSVKGDGVGRLGDAFGLADTVLVGPGLDDGDETKTLLRGHLVCRRGRHAGARCLRLGGSR